MSTTQRPTQTYSMSTRYSVLQSTWYALPTSYSSAFSNQHGRYRLSKTSIELLAFFWLWRFSYQSSSLAFSVSHWRSTEIYWGQSCAWISWVSCGLISMSPLVTWRLPLRSSSAFSPGYSFSLWLVSICSEIPFRAFSNFTAFKWAIRTWWQP